MNICQSCGIPLYEKYKGTNSDSSLSEEYCSYCYENGEFIDDRTLEEEVEHLIPMYIDDRDISVEEARNDLTKILAPLKRWSEQ
ncbi:MAG TPA: transcriptional regulator [Methanosphaera sp.]|nr:transcriptional regulator [Methanosphaera sp.]